MVTLLVFVLPLAALVCSALALVLALRAGRTAERAFSAQVTDAIARQVVGDAGKGRP